MTPLFRPLLGRRSLMAGAAGSALLAGAGRVPVHAQAIAPAGGQTAAIDGG